MDTAQLLVTVLGAGGGGAVLLALINGLFKWLSGASGREREKNTDLITQRRNAIEDRDAADDRAEEADRKRRASDDYAATLRRQLLENGIQPGDWPHEHTVPRNQLPKPSGGWKSS